MKIFFKLFGIIILVTVIGFSMAACGGDDDPPDGGNPPGNNNNDIPDAGWWSWNDPTSTAKINHSVDADGVCAINVSGVAMPHNETEGWNSWKAQAGYSFTAKANTSYTYVFEAWTKEGTRAIDIQYYWDENNENNDLYFYYNVLTTERKTYTLKGLNIPKGGVSSLRFLVANQLGTFYVKILSITPRGGEGGKTWTVVSDSKISGPGNTSAIHAIAYGNGKFVAGASSGKMAYSTDGTTWTAVVDSPFGSNDRIIIIVSGNDNFVACSEEFGDYDNYVWKMAYSTDGITWTAVVDNPFGSNEGIDNIVYGDDKFIAYGYGFDDDHDNIIDYNKIAYSTDGIIWTTVEDCTSVGNYIAYGNDIFVSLDTFGKVSTSIDGITWTTDGNESQVVFNMWDIVYGNDKFVAVGPGGRIAYSTDGTTWTAVTNSTFGSNDGIMTIAYGNGRFFAVSSSSTETDDRLFYSGMETSTDGINWTAVSNSGFDTYDGINDIVYGNGKFVAGGYYGKMWYWEDD